MVIISVVLFNMVNLWMMYGDICMVGCWMVYWDRMVYWHIHMVHSWLFMVVVRVVLFHAMHIWMVWSNWVPVCCSMHRKVLSGVMHISVDVSMMHRRNWVAVDCGMYRLGRLMHLVMMFWNVGVVVLSRDHLGKDFQVS